MKQCVMSLLFFLCLGSNIKTFAQSQEAKQLLLDVEKLASLKNILTDLKKGYAIVSEGYNTIRNISEGNFNLHETFLNSLLQISPTVKNYKRIADIINAQIKIVSEYKKAFRNFQTSNLFNPGEIEYLGKVYSNLFNRSVKSLDDLAMVVTAGKLRMSDDERLSAIDEIWKKVKNEQIFLRHFNNSTKILALQRAKEQNDVSEINQLYDVNH
ncbi:MAG TPA: TerB family tellurite resistance protein [Chitinophagaceae bacterium]